MPTNEHNNTSMLTALFGVDGANSQALGLGIGYSPLNRRQVDIQTAPYTNGQFTHFTERTVPNWLTLTEEGTTTAAATYGLGLQGEATMTSDDIAAKSDQWTSGLCWQINRQASGDPLIAEVRWKAGATITASEYWVGLTDAAPDTDPIALSTTSTFTTSVPSDGLYMGYSATPTSGAAFTSGGNQHTMIGINNDTNTIITTGGGAFAASTYYTYRFECDVTGVSRAYINGTLIGTTTAATGPRITVPLCLMICVTPRTTVSAAITADYAGISGR